MSDFSRRARILSFCKHCPSSGTHHITLRECELCGTLEWVSSEERSPFVMDSFTVLPLPPGSCGVCITAYQRAPEVFAWVSSVVRRLKETS